MMEDVEFLREVFEKQSWISSYRSSHHLLTYSTCQKHKDYHSFEFFTAMVDSKFNS